MKRISPRRDIWPMGSSLLPMLLALLLSSAETEVATAARQISVRLRDARVVSGDLDPGTNEWHLWLRSAAPGVELRSCISWDTIVAVDYNENAYPADEFRRLVLGGKSQLLIDADFIDSELFDPDPANAWARRAHEASLLWRRAKRVQPHGPPHPPRLPRVCSVQIETFPANWDSDVETDGLRVIVRPLDEHATVVAVDGRIEFQLIGRQLATSRQPRRNRLFPELGRWTKQLRACHFGPHGIVVELPFQLVHPEFNLDLGAEGLLTARLSVPGEGVFDTSRADVLLRPFSRMRDELELYREQRYFPIERTRRTPRAPNSRFVRPKLRG